MILLDTHALVWLSEGSSKLGKKSLVLIDEALQNNELFISTVSFWEVAMLIEKGRLTMDFSVSQWRLKLLKHDIQEIPLSGEVAIGSAQLINFHGDPADRMIVTTAIKSVMKLCTADQKILDWEDEVLRINAKL